MTTTSKNTSTTWHKFSEKRPIPLATILIDKWDGSPVLGFIPSHDQSKYYEISDGEITGEPRIIPTHYRWQVAPGGRYEKPASRASNPHHHDHETEEQFQSRTGTGIPENPKDTIGSRKLPLSTLPWAVLAEAAAGMGEGALKYGKHNYEVVGIRNSIYFDATMRHLIAWFLGEDIDPDSGLPHITKALTSLLVLRDAQIYNKVTDDRPPACPPEHLQQVKDLFASLIEGVPDCGKHYDRTSIKARENGKARTA